MMMLGASSMLPGWVVIPVAGATMVVIAAHVLALQQAEMPARRRRIRTANGLLMMFVSALFAYAIGIAPWPGTPLAAPGVSSRFLVLWTMVIGLVAIVVVLAGVDAATTIRQNVERRRAIRRELRDGLRGDLGAARSGGTRGGERGGAEER